MDIMKLDGTSYDDGDIINGLKSVIWIERYASNGEFTIEATPSADMLDKLAIGSLLSHVETKDVMMVESHEIDETKEDVTLKVTGRTVDVIAMENRIITDDYNGGGPWTSNFTEEQLVYAFPAGNTWDEIVTLITDFLDVPLEGSPEALPNFSVYNTIPGTESPQVERTLKKLSTLAETISEMLASIDAGIRVERPQPSHPTTLQFVIHKGVDVSETIQFSWDQGDIDSAKYFWSNKSVKNAAYISGDIDSYKLRPGSETGFDLRVMAIDASDWKPAYSRPLNPLATYAVATALMNRGLDVLSKQKAKAILEATVAPNSRFKYRTHYNIGDKVFVEGNYGVGSVMRVTEYAETEDENGESGFPTLSQV